MGVSQVYGNYQRHFREMEFNSHSNPIGIHELTENEAARIAHYRFTYRTYNGHIRVSKVEYFNEDQQLADDNVYGVGIFTFDYNGQGLKVKQMYWNRDHNITELFGIAITEFYYDENGKEVEQRFYNQYDELCSGLAIVQFDYDEQGYLIQQTYFDKEGNCYIDENTEVAIYRFQYDQLGRLVQISHHSCTGNLVENSWGVAFVRYYYHEDQDGGRLQAIRKYDKDGVYISG